MAVAFDAVGPSSTGSTGTTSPQTWSHTCGAAATALYVGVAIDSSSDAADTVAVTYNGVSMTSMGRMESGGAAQHAGFIQVFKLASPPTGSAFNVVVTATGIFNEISGGSVSVTGSGSEGSIATSDSAATNVTSGTVTVPSTTSGNLVLGFLANGSGGISFTSGTSRYVTAGTGTNAAGFAGCATSASTGSSVAIGWNQTTDWFGAIAFEVRAAGTPMTVTATQGGTTPFNGILLSVLVLNNAKAAASQTGATGSAGAFTTSVTTTVTGSWVLGGTANSNAGTATANGNSALISDHSDTTNGAAYTTWKSAAATGTPGATTFGITSTGAANSTVSAAAEILPNGTIAQDASTPAAAETDAATAVTTASFTPPAGSLLAAVVATDSNGAAVTVAITDSAGLTWRQLKFADGASFEGAGVWVADVPGAAVASAPMPQRGGSTWRRRFRRIQQLILAPVTSPPPPPVVGQAEPNIPWQNLPSPMAQADPRQLFVPWPPWTDGAPPPVVNAGLATATGTAPGISTASAAFTRVQHNSMGTSSTTAASLSATLGLGVTSGNLLVATIVVGTNVGTVTPPAGWAQAGPAETVIGSLQTQIFYLVVGTGGATSFAFSWTGLHSFGWTIEEWSSSAGWPSNPVDSSAGATNAGTPVGCGSPAVTTKAPELWSGVLSWSNSGQTLSGITAGWTTGDSAVFTSNNTQTAFFQIAAGTGTPSLAATISAGQTATAGVVATFLPVTGTSAGLATAAGTAFSPGVGLTPGLATGNGTASAPGIGITAGLATATGSASAPAVGLTPVLATATGTASGISIQVIAGLASGTGAANAPNLGLTPGLAAGTGTASGISQAVNAGLAAGTGNAFAPGTGLTPALATATGTASGISVRVNAGLATGTGASFAPGTGLTPGLATGTGTAGGISIVVNAGLATGTGTAGNVTVQQPGINAGLATAAGTAGGISMTVNAGLATGTGAAGGIAVPVNAGLATGTGNASAPGIGITAGLATGTGSTLAPSAPRTAGLATGAGTAPGISKGVNAGLATGTGSALNAVNSAGQHNVDYTGSTLANPDVLGGTLAIATFDGTLSVAVNSLGGTLAVAANSQGGTVTVATFGGTLAVTSDTLTGTLSVAVNSFSGTTVEDKMQEVDIILNEFNDATVTFQVLNGGSPMNITGMSVNALFKKTRGDLDSAGTTTLYTSTGGTPAITIVTPSTGSCSLAIPHAAVIGGAWSFYRIDVINGTVTTSAIFGTVTITLL